MARATVERVALRMAAVAALALAAALGAGAAGAQAAATPPAAASPAASAPPLGPVAPWVPPDVPQGSGPWPALMEMTPALPQHTLYRPARLDLLGATRLPLVVWANGACVNVGNRFRPYLTEIASHGYLVVALGPIGPREVEAATSGSAWRGAPAPGSPAARAIAEGRMPAPGTTRTPPPETSPQQMVEAIDWALAENTRAGSPLAGRIDTGAIAVMGQSCGGVQAIAAALDRRVKTLGVWNSGLFSDDTRPLAIAGAAVTKASLKSLHTSALYVTGEPSEVAFKNADDDVDRIDGVPVVRAWLEGTGHSGTYRERDGGAYAAVAVAWLQWQLRADVRAAAMFQGADCYLCRNPRWHVRRKKID
jgi:dienelactone hydrolase